MNYFATLQAQIYYRSLTPRQREMLKLRLERKMTLKEIAFELNVAPGVVANTFTAIFKRLNIGGFEELLLALLDVCESSHDESSHDDSSHDESSHG